MENFGGRRRFGGPRRRFGGGFSQDKPVKEGETYDVEILEVGSKGDGIAKIQNFVIFVAGTQKGQKVKIRITQVRATSAVGEVVSGGAEEPAEEQASEEQETISSEESSEEDEEEPEEEPEEQPEEKPKEQPEEEPAEEPEEEKPQEE